jgi:hypothetical protein
MHDEDEQCLQNSSVKLEVKEPLWNWRRRREDHIN